MRTLVERILLILIEQHGSFTRLFYLFVKDLIEFVLTIIVRNLCYKQAWNPNQQLTYGDFEALKQEPGKELTCVEDVKSPLSSSLRVSRSRLSTRKRRENPWKQVWASWTSPPSRFQVWASWASPPFRFQVCTLSRHWPSFRWHSFCWPVQFPSYQR